MTAEEFESAHHWLGRKPLRSLKPWFLLVHARNQPAVRIGWSDWDFPFCQQFRTWQFYGTEWLAEIAPVWCAHAERTPRGVIKVSAVFEGGWEADFVPLAVWQMKLVYWGMRHPELEDVDASPAATGHHGRLALSSSVRATGLIGEGR